MEQRFNILIFFLLVGCALPIRSQVLAESAPPLQVIITGTMTDTEARRDFVAGKIIIGRKRIEESGVRTVEELLKREPAVTISGDGRLGLLNMPGYTQVLVDGHEPLPSQDISVLDLVHVEKVEIIKSSVAEFGPFGMAGTINIVTRSTAHKTNTDFSAGLRSAGGHTSSTVSLSHNQSTAGSPIRLGFQLSADNADTASESRVRQVLLIPGQRERNKSQASISGAERNKSATFSSNLTWQRDSDETISVSPDLYIIKGPARQVEMRHWEDGTTLDMQQELRSSLTILALPVKWVFKPGKKSRFELNARAHLTRFETELNRRDSISAQTPTLQQNSQYRESRGDRLELGYKVSLDGDHEVKLGASLVHSRENTDFDYRINGLPDLTLAALGTKRQLLSEKRGVYAQDEWRLNESVALTAGISGAINSLDVNEGKYNEQTSFQLWSPSFHASKKIGDDDKRQFRLSLARSFKAPENDSFTARPNIHPLAPCPASGLCGPNTIDTADMTGNPRLRPESALGLNLAYEHGIGADSQFTVELYTRRISEKLGTEIIQDSVPWAVSPRYLQRPANLGDARSAGINFEVELALHDLSESAPKATIRGSLGLDRSQVFNLPGPDNRLDKQTPWTAKLGGSYGMENLPLKFNIDANWSPSVWVRTSLSERISVARRFDLDASTNWVISKDMRLSFSVKTAFPRTTPGANEYLSASETVRIGTLTKKYTQLSIRLESKL